MVKKSTKTNPKTNNKKLEQARDFPDHHLKRLSGSQYYRLRIGDYRAIIDWKKQKNELFLREIDHRKNIYK